MFQNELPENDVSESTPASDSELLFKVSPFDELKLVSGMNSGDWIFRLLLRSSGDDWTVDEDLVFELLLLELTILCSYMGELKKLWSELFFWVGWGGVKNEGLVGPMKRRMMWPDFLNPSTCT